MRNFSSISTTKHKKHWRRWLLIGAIILSIGAAFLIPSLRAASSSGRWAYYRALLIDRDSMAEFILQPGMRCGNAPFAFPTTGAVIGLWDQSYRLGHRHQGLDIFAGSSPGATPVYAAYSGYLTRLSDWVATVIIRIPSDPLLPSQQIWTYYTHMASQQGNSFISEDFPMGTKELFVEEGTFLGFQGNFSGNLLTPTGLHLHFSVVKDNGQGSFLNELEIKNTLDPSPYFNLAVNHNNNASEIPVCELEISYANWNLLNADG